MYSRNRLTRFFLLAMLVASLCLTACGDSTPTIAPTTAKTAASQATAPATSTGTTPPLSLTYALNFMPDPFHSGLFVAVQKGWFKEEGIDLTILPPSQGVFSTVLVANGKADVSFTGPEDMLFAIAAGAPLVSLATVYPHNDTVLVSRKESGLTTPKQLEGKKYAGYGAPFEQPMLNTMIKTDGGNPQFQNIVVGPQAVDAVVNKQADFSWGQMGWQVIQAKLQGVELNTISVTKYGVPDQGTLYAFTSQPVLSTKAEAIRRFLKALTRGYEYAIANPKEAADLLIASQPKGTFGNPDLIYKSQEYVSGRLKENSEKWGVQTLKAWTEYPKFLYNNKVLVDKDNKPLTQELDYAKLFTNDYLPK